MMNPLFPVDSRKFSHRFVLREITPQGVAMIRFHRPEVRNALNPAAMFQLHSAVSDAIADPSVRAIVVTASEPGFVFGADVEFLVRHIRQDSFGSIHAYTRLGNDCFDRIASSPKPVIAAINGPAYGGGVELALACHVRLASPSAVLALPEVGLGLCPLWGGILRLRLLVGQELAKWIVYTGKNISARDAVKLGIVNRIADADQLLKIALETAGSLISPAKNHFVPEPEYEELVRFFAHKSIESIFGMETYHHFGKIAQVSVKQIKKKCFLAARYCETIFDWPENMTPNQKDQAYYEIVEQLYRSSDTLMGLEWRQKKKIGVPDFPSSQPFLSKFS